MLDKALSYYQKSLKYANKTSDDTLKGKILNNLANIYFFEKKDTKKGIEYYKKSLFHTKRTADTTKLFLRNANITWAYFQEKKFNIGKVYLDFLNKYKSKFADESTLPLVNMLNALHAESKNDTTNAAIFYEKAIRYGEKSNEKYDLSVTYKNYASFLAKRKKIEQAYIYSKKFEDLNNQILNDSKVKQAKNTGQNLEINEYKREINQVSSNYKSKEIVWQQEHKNHQKTIIIFLTLSLTIILIFFGYSKFEKLKRKNKYKRLIIQNQQNILSATIDGQEMERKKIAAFLHDNISALLSSAGIHLNIFNIQHPNESQEILKTKKILEEAHQKVRDLFHELIPSLLVRFGLIYALEDLCEKNSNSNISIEFEQIVKTPLQLEETKELKIYFMVSELINNIIKHSNANWAKVAITTTSNLLQIEVKDNGKGFDQQNQQINEGYGLNRIKARISNIKGTISILSSSKEGTAVQLRIPLV